MRIVKRIVLLVFTGVFLLGDVIALILLPVLWIEAGSTKTTRATTIGVCIGLTALVMACLYANRRLNRSSWITEAAFSGAEIFFVPWGFLRFIEKGPGKVVFSKNDIVFKEAKVSVNLLQAFFVLHCCPKQNGLVEELAMNTSVLDRF